MTARGLLAARHDPVRYRNARRLEADLGARLVHRKRGSEHARMRIGDFQRLKHALDAAVLAPFAVKRIETGIGFEKRKPVGDVAVHVDGRNPIAEVLQRACAGRAGSERNIPFRRPAAHQDRDMVELLCHSAAARWAPSPGTPMRLISHSSVIPLCANTRSRTSSPSCSMSAAVAP